MNRQVKICVFLIKGRSFFQYLQRAYSLALCYNFKVKGCDFLKQTGVLLHISSLPGDYGCGTLGRTARDFADLLQKGGFTRWQVLPLNRPHEGGSPYSSPCTYLQNPLFIDPEILFEKELLSAEELSEIKRNIPPNGASFNLFYRAREPYLHRAAERAKATLEPIVCAFLQSRPHVAQGCRFLANGEADLFYHGFLQYEFHLQWQALRDHCHTRGIRLMGDLPFYPDLHSSEVQFHKENFLLDERGAPLFESGVPGDDFTDEGQHWGHPLYRTEALRAQHYAPLLARFTHAASLFDEVRIDHFQALLRYYAIPVGRPVREGHWEEGLGENFLHTLTQSIPPARLVAEDLGCFQHESRALAQKFGIPPMNVLQFALLGGGSAADFEPHSVAYTGTHDCDTLVGFFTSIHPDTRAAIAARLGETAQAPSHALALAAMRHLLQSPAERVIFQAQDLLLLGSEARMNVPGTTVGNWRWRLSPTDMETLENLTPLWG